MSNMNAKNVDMEIVNYCNEVNKFNKLGFHVVWLNPVDKVTCSFSAIDHSSNAFKEVIYAMALKSGNIDKKQFKHLMKKAKNTIKPYPKAKADNAIMALKGFLDIMNAEYLIMVEHLEAISESNDLGKVNHYAHISEGFNNEDYKFVVSEAVEYLGEVVQQHNKNAKKRAGNVMIFTKGKRE